MQPSHGISLAPAPARVAGALVKPSPRRHTPGVQRNSLAFAAVTGAIVWKTWTARRQRSPQQSEKMNSRHFFSTGNFQLDLALHGGLPRGRMVEIFGEPQCGKTSLAFSCLEAALRNGQSCAVLDVDRQWPGCKGAEDRLLRVRPQNVEMAMEMMVDIVHSRKYDLIILDSVACLISKAEAESGMGSSSDGIFDITKQLSIFCSKMSKILPDTGVTIIFTNVLKNSRWSEYGSHSEATFGGNAVKYRSSVRIAVRQLEPPEPSTDGDEVKAVRTRLEVVKNKDAPKGPPVECNLMLGKGISWENSVVEAALDLRVLAAQPDAADESSLTFQGTSRARSDWAKALEENPKICQKLTKACRKAWLERM